MVEKLKSKKTWVKIFAILIVQLTLSPRNCDGQFHWGKNYRLERKQLRDMFSQAASQNALNSQSIPIMDVSK